MEELFHDRPTPNTHTHTQTTYRRREHIVKLRGPELGYSIQKVCGCMSDLADFFCYNGLVVLCDEFTAVVLVVKGARMCFCRSVLVAVNTLAPTFCCFQKDGVDLLLAGETTRFRGA